MADSLKADLWKAAKHPRTRPWLAVAAELPATLAAHHFWGDSAVAGAGLTVAAGVLTASTWWAGQGTSAARRMHATLSAGAATAYMVVGTVTDPLAPGLVSTLVIGGAVAAGGWNIRQALRVNVDPARADAAAETGVLVKSIGKARAALRGAPAVEPNKVTAPLQLSGGDLTTDELGNRVKHIAGELGVSPTAIRFIPDPDRADRTTLVVVPEDQLKGGATYPGPSRLGGSITDPIPVGIYEDGATAVIWFPWDRASGRNATHFLLAGMNGSGKSVGMTVAITEALTRQDVIVWAADPSKGQQTFGPLLPYFDWVEMSMAGGEAMVEALKSVITARADALGRAGFKNWTPEAFEKLGMPYMVVWFEEAAKFFREGTEMEGLVMEARSAGISVIVSLQRPSSTSMPTDVREQLGGVLCFGVKGSTTADMALPDDVRDAGARPEAWENRKPGYAYLVAPGVDEERYAMPIRTYLIDDDAVAAALALAPRPPADPITAAAAGEAYAGRRRYDAAVTITDTMEVPMPETPEQAMAREKAALGARVEREIAAALGDDPDDDGFVPEVDAEEELPPADAVWSFGAAPADGQEDKKTEEATAELLLMLAEYREEGLEIVGPRHFQPYGKGSRIGRSRAWVSGKLGDLVDDGVHLAEGDKAGEYRLLYPELATV